MINDITIKSNSSEIEIIKTNDKWSIKGISEGNALLTIESIEHNISKEYNINVLPIIDDSSNN